jgi:purine nucleoside phosphorylase
MPQAKIGVIGGTGLYDIKGLTDIEEVDKIKTGAIKLPLSRRGYQATARRLAFLLYHI